MSLPNSDQQYSQPEYPGLARCFVVAIFAIGTFDNALNGQDRVWTVKRLNDSKPWERLVDTPIKVEGRIGISGGGQAGAEQFRLLRCDARFVIDNATAKFTVPRSNSDVKTVEISGRFKKSGVKVVFFAEDIKLIPGYLEQYENKTTRLHRPTPEDWVELGDWTLDRARFYEDADLEKKARDAFSNSIELEFRGLKNTDAAGRFSLVKKIDHYGLSKRRRAELVHDGFRIQWQGMQSAEKLDTSVWQQFAAKLKEELPGTNEPLKMVPPDLKETYEQDPISTYQKANGDQRVQLHRLFFIAVTRKALLRDASDDGRDGDSIAEQIDKIIPEEHGLAEKHRTLRLNHRIAHVTVATRSDVENLAAALRSRHRREDADAALVNWVKSHVNRLRDDGAIGLMQLADEYLNLLNDETTAVEYLSDAYRMDPSFNAAKTKLMSLGYQWNGNRWVKTENRSKEVENLQSTPPSGIHLRLSASGLRTLMGEPRSLARTITSKGNTEIWSYGPAGSSQLVIRLEQLVSDNEPVVTAFPGQELYRFGSERRSDTP